MKTGRHALLGSRFRQQVAGQLLNRELIEGQVPVAGADDPPDLPETR